MGDFDVKIEGVEEGFAKPSFFTQIIPIYSNHDTLMMFLKRLRLKFKQYWIGIPF